MATTRDEVLAAISRSNGSSMSGSRRNNAPSPEQREVINSITRGSAQLGFTPRQESGGGGILGAALDPLTRAFDVASRPLYAVAGLADSLMNGEEDPVSAIVSGLTGRDKTTFSDVLERSGVENDLIRGVLGFGLDVAADPLTYVGGSVVKAASKEAIETATKRGIVDALDSPAAKEAAEWSNMALLKGKTTGQQINSADFTSAKVAGMLASDDVIEAGMRNADEVIKREGPGRVNLTLFGKDTDIGSEKLYDLGQVLSRKVSGTRVGNAFNKAFRPTATFKAGTNVTRRIVDSVTMADAERLGSIMAKGGKIGDYEISGLTKLTPDERIQVTHALESGVRPTDPALSKAYDDSEYLFQRLREEEAGLGIRSSDDYIDNYVDHHFDRTIKGNDPDLVNEWTSARKNEAKVLRTKQNEWIDKTRKKLEKQGKTPEQIAEHILKNMPARTSKYTTERAALQGLEPETDIAKIVGNRILDHTRRSAEVHFDTAIAGEFGVRIGTTKKASEIAKQLGLRPPPKEAAKYIDEGIYFPREIEKVLRKHKEFYFGSEESGSALLNLYDDVLGKVKFFQTAANPGHHIRNMLGDMSNNALNGLVRSQPYHQALDIIRAVSRPDSFLHADVGLKQAFGQDAKSILVNVGGRELNGEQIYNYFVKSGGKSGFFRSEIAEGKHRATEFVRGVAEKREDFARLANFIHSFDEEAAKIAKGAELTPDQLDRAANLAAQRVRKYNFDYGDLTPFEQKAMKRVVPFYTFMRKNVPMQIESMFMKPGRQMLTPKFIQNLQVAMGGEDPNMDILGVNMLPDYLRQAMAVNLIGEGEGRNGVYWNPSGISPLLSLRETFGDGGSIADLPRGMVEGQLAGLTPFAQVPLQQITGYNFFTGRETDNSLLENVVSTVPVGRMGYGQLSGEKPISSASLLNYLTGTGLQEVTPGMQQGELRRQEDIIQALLRSQSAGR
jgi:hypothetical protein